MLLKKKNFIIRFQRNSFSEIKEIYASDKKAIDKILTLSPSSNNLHKIKKSALPDTIKVRVVKLALKNGEFEVLVTSLLDQALFTVNDFSTIYNLRWCIETFFGKLKGRLNIDHFSGKSLNAIKQDIWSTIFLSNLETIITEDIDERIKNESISKGIKQKRIKKSISFNAIKNAAIDLFYNETNYEIILEKIRGIILVEY